MRKTTITKLKKECDRVFSLWVRNRERACVTCGSRNNLQAGHYVSRSVNILRFDERNVHTQCVSCNIFKRGNMVEYSAFMLRKYGPDIIKKLLKEKQRLHQFTRKELEKLIKHYNPQR